MNKLVLMFFVCVLLLLVTGICRADRRVAPDEYPAIQEVIEAAGAGNMVIVSHGRYGDTTDSVGKAITVRSDTDGDPGDRVAPADSKSGLDEIRKSLDCFYFICDRMEPNMKKKEVRAVFPFLCVIYRNSSIREDMLPIFMEVLILIDNPDMTIPKKLRDEIKYMTYRVEGMMGREGIVSADLSSLLPEIRSISQDRTMRTVNEMLRGYGRKERASTARKAAGILTGRYYVSKMP